MRVMSQVFALAALAGAVSGACNVPPDPPPSIRGDPGDWKPTFNAPTRSRARGGKYRPKPPTDDLPPKTARRRAKRAAAIAAEAAWTP